jgi:integrase
MAKKLSSKAPIRLRERTMPSGNISLYLDIYIDGKRSYEYLKLYLVPEHNSKDKEKNRETMRLAEAIKAKRIVELQNGIYGFKKQKSEKQLFLPYYEAKTEARRGTDTNGNWGNWRSCINHLKKYDPQIAKRTFDEIDHDYIQGFKDYLENEACAWSSNYTKRFSDHKLSRNSKVSYFNKLRACIRAALDEGIITQNPLRGIEGIRGEEGTRMYLTIDEVRKLFATPCDYPIIKNAFLFSCLTGLRRSDILKLTWGEVYQQGEFTRIIFKQKKTGGQEYLDITDEAVALMGERGKPTDRPFAEIHSPSCTNRTIETWCLRAGITKKITFHCGRHTFATMMLDLGTDLYTTSKLLGHRFVSTTQIYAKVMDKNKQAAVANIPKFFTDENKEK